jgi:hypothetical protein
LHSNNGILLFISALSAQCCSVHENVRDSAALQLVTSGICLCYSAYDTFGIVAQMMHLFGKDQLRLLRLLQYQFSPVALHLQWSHSIPVTLVSTPSYV